MTTERTHRRIDVAATIDKITVSADVVLTIVSTEWTEARMTACGEYLGREPMGHDDLESIHVSNVLAYRGDREVPWPADWRKAIAIGLSEHDSCEWIVDATMIEVDE